MIESLKQISDELVKAPAMVNEIVEKEVPMKTSSMVGIFAEYVVAIIRGSDAASRLFDDNKLKLEDVEAYFSDLLRLRLMQVSGKKMPMSPAKIEVPACFYPVLELIGEYISAEEGKFLKPSSSDDLILSQDLRDRLARIFRIARMPIEAGLPRATLIESDDLFRLTVRDGRIYASTDGTGIDPATVLARTFVEFLALDELYGQYRFAYQDIRLIGTAYDRLSRLGMSN